jgi:hypothetical protein
VPRSPADIDPTWLTAALRGRRAGPRVVSVSVADPMVGTTTRAVLELTYDRDPGDLPRRLFTKCTTTFAQRLMLGLGGFIADEPYFYTFVRPGLEIEAPIGFFAAVDDRSWRSIVLIEDVVDTRGAVFWDPSTRITRDRIEALLANVARWHGTLWESPRLLEWPWLRTPGEHMDLIDALIGMADRRRAGVRRAHGVIPSSLRTRQHELHIGLRLSMEMNSSRPWTYLHGDLHAANTYLTASGAAGVVDWQIGLRGSWAFDVAYLLATALEVGDRRAWERELLDLYLGCLSGAGGDAPPYEQAWQAYRSATFYPYFAWIYTIGRSRLQPKFQSDEVCLVMIERIAAAIADLDSLGAVGL